MWTGEPKKEEETPLKKYKRLNCEGQLFISQDTSDIYLSVRELLDDIKNSQSDGSEQGYEVSDINNNPTDCSVSSLDKMSVELEKLHHLLVQMRLEDVTGENRDL